MYQDTYGVDNEWESDDSDDSVEEIQIKRYLNPSLESGLLQAKALQGTHIGVKKQRGYYQLSDLRHAVINQKQFGYEGHHYDVEVRTDLHRSTPKLTHNAINRELDKEQKRRTKIEAETRKQAKSSLTGLNNEYKENLNISEKKIKEDEANERHELSIIKDEVQVEMGRKQSVRAIEGESEEERKRQIKLLKAMTSEAEKTPSITELVDGMADTNHKKQIIQQDLNEAFARLCDDQDELTIEYRKALTELLDESMITLSLMLDRDKTKQLSCEEQMERIKKQYDLIYDKMKWENLNRFDEVMFDLRRIFKKVEQLEDEEDRKYRERQAELKAMVQEELLRKYARKWVEKATANERMRRLKEDLGEPKDKDPMKETMKTVIMRMQRQMILNKFKGNWVDPMATGQKSVERDDEDYEEESDYDKKLRLMRTKNRRQSRVAKGIAD